MAAAGGAGAAAPGAAPAAPAYRHIGRGSYGIVIKPALPNINDHGAEIHHPNNVTKLFYSEVKKDKALANSQRIVGILGNESHRAYPYTKSYRHSRLFGLNVNQQIQANLATRGVNRRLPLQTLRMRDLGIEIGKISNSVHYNQLRNVSFLTILQQIRKVFGQINRLVESNYIHGDVRQSNVLINPITGVISLIDFDWLYPSEEFFGRYLESDAFGFYSNPPESLLLSNRYPNPLPSITDPAINPADIIATIPANVNEVYNNYVRATVLLWDGVKGTNLATVIRDIDDALIHNIHYLRSRIVHGNSEYAVATGMINETFDRFDNYGLAATILILLKHVYRMNPPHTAWSQAVHVNFIRPRIKDNGRDYTVEELERIVAALYSLEDLLNRVSSFRIDQRPTSRDVLAELDEIIARFQPAPAPAAVPAAPNVAAAAVPAAPNVAAEIAAGIAAAVAGPNFGGARRSRRHRTHGRRSKTQRFRRSRKN